MSRNNQEDAELRSRCAFLLGGIACTFDDALSFANTFEIVEERGKFTAWIQLGNSVVYRCADFNSLPALAAHLAHDRDAFVERDNA